VRVRSVGSQRDHGTLLGVKHVGVGIAFIVVGLIIMALQPALKRGLTRNGASSAGIRVYGNVITGLVIAAVGVAVVAGAF
jgi:hypothetical protein